MPDPKRRTRLLQELMLASSDIARMSELIVQLKSAPPVDEERMERAVQQWIGLNLRAKALRDELQQLDDGPQAQQS